MWDKLEQINNRYREIDYEMAKPEVTSDPNELQKLAQEKAAIDEVVTVYREYRVIEKSLEETREMLRAEQDEEMSGLVKQEVAELESKLELLSEQLKKALIPRDPNDEKNIIMEIRAGAGGDEAGLFAADLFRMYTRYAQSRNWNVEIINANESGIGGFKEVIFEVAGKGAFSRLKY